MQKIERRIEKFDNQINKNDDLYYSLVIFFLTIILVGLQAFLK